MANGEVIIDINGDISGFQSEMNKVDGIVKSATSSFNSFSENITKSFLIVGSAITTAGSGFAASVMNVGKDFEAQMSTVQALSGATADDLGLLTDKAKELGASTSFTGTQVGEAFEYMALAGWGTDEMLVGVQGALDTAAASGEDLATVTDILTDGLTAFGMSASDSAQFADVLATTSANSNTTISMLGEAFKYVAPLAGTLGYSVEDVSVALGLMADNGIKSSQAGTTLRSALTSMISPSNNAYTAMEELGLATDGTITAMMNSDGSTKSLNETLVILRSTFSELTQEEQANYASTIFGTEAMSGMLAVINSSDDAFNTLTANIDDATGSASEMANIKLDNLQGDITKLGSAVEGLKLQIYDLAMENDQARSSVEQFSTSVGNISNAITTGGVIGAIEQLGTEVARMSVSIVAEAPNIVKGVTTLMTSFTSTLTAYIPEITTTFVSTLGALTDGYNQFIPSFKILVSNIAPLVVEALVTLAPLMWEMGVEVLTSMAEGIASNMPEIVDAGTKAIDSLLNTILDNLPSIIDSGVTIILGIVEGIVDYLPELVEVSIKIIGALAEGLIDNMPEIVACALTVMTSLASAFVENIPLIVETGLNIGKELFSAFTSGIIEIAQKLGSELGFIETIVASAVAGFGAFVTAVTVFNSVQTAVTTVTTALSTVKSTISTVSSVAQIAFGIFTANPFNAVAVAIGVLVTAVILLIANFDDIKAACTSVWNAVSEFVSNMVTKFTEGFDNIKQKVSEFGSNIIEGFNSAKDTCLNTISNLVDSISNAFENFDWKSVGSNIISGITSGVSSMISSATSSIKKVASSMYDTVTDFFDIHSPSRLMRDDVGENIVLGMVEGVDNNSDEAVAIMDNLAQAMTDPMPKYIAMSNDAIEHELQTTLGILTAQADLIENANTDTINSTYAMITEKLDMLNLSSAEELSIYQSMTSMLEYGSKERLDLEERYQDALYESRINSIDALKNMNAVSITDELAMYTELASQLKEGSDERLATEYKYQETLYNYRLNSIGEYKDLYTMSYAEELSAYVALQKSLSENSEQRVETEKLIQDTISAISQLSANEQMKIWSEVAQSQATDSELRITAEEKYLDAKQTIASQILAIEDEYNAAYETRSDAIMNMTALFSAASEREIIESKTLMENLQGQVDQLANWGQMLQELADKGIADALFLEIQELGVGAMDELDALLKMTDEELSKYSQLYEDKQVLANSLATKQLAELRNSMDSEIAQLINGVEYEFGDLVDVGRIAVANMNDATSSELQGLSYAFADAGNTVKQELSTSVNDAGQVFFGLSGTTSDAMGTVNSAIDNSTAQIDGTFQMLGSQIVNTLEQAMNEAGQHFYTLVGISSNAMSEVYNVVQTVTVQMMYSFDMLAQQMASSIYNAVSQIQSALYSLSSMSVIIPVTTSYSSSGYSAYGWSGSSSGYSAYSLNDSSSGASTYSLNDSSSGVSTYGLGETAISTFSNLGTISTMETGVSNSGASTNSYSTINNSDNTSNSSDTNISINIEYLGTQDTAFDFDDIAQYLANAIDSQMRQRGLT